MRLRTAPTWPVLAGLTLSVAVAHLVLLANAPLAISQPDRLGTRVFSTRLLVPVAAPTPVVEAPPPAPAAAPRPRARSPAATPPDPSATAAAPALPASAARPDSARAAEPVATAAAAPASAALSDAQAVPGAPQESVATRPPETAPAPVAALTPASPPASAPAAAPAPAPTTARDTLAVASTSAASAEPRPLYAVPGSVRLKFIATGQRNRMDYHALGELLWQHDGKRYDARLELGAVFIGTRVVSSTGAIGADGLAPERYADKYRRELATHFDRAQQRIVFSNNRPQAELLPGAQDQLSVFMQLAALIGGAPERYPPGSVLALPTAGPRASEIWSFTIQEPETISLPGGSLRALRLTRRAGKDYDQMVELWLAPELSYMPARIRITLPNGDFVDQKWRSTERP